MGKAMNQKYQSQISNELRVHGTEIGRGGFLSHIMERFVSFRATKLIRGDFQFSVLLVEQAILTHSLFLHLRLHTNLKWDSITRIKLRRFLEMIIFRACTQAPI